MSLLDALLLDPYRINIWIALRSDGVKGSGTQNDPYDGSTATRLDTILNTLVANTRIHFGPGTFQINGFRRRCAKPSGSQTRCEGWARKWFATALIH